MSDSLQTLPTLKKGIMFEVIVVLLLLIFDAGLWTLAKKTGSENISFVAFVFTIILGFLILAMMDIFLQKYSYFSPPPIRMEMNG